LDLDENDIHQINKIKESKIYLQELSSGYVAVLTASQPYIAVVAIPLTFWYTGVLIDDIIARLISELKKAIADGRINPELGKAIINYVIPPQEVARLAEITRWRGIDLQMQADRKKAEVLKVAAYKAAAVKKEELRQRGITLQRQADLRRAAPAKALAYKKAAARKEFLAKRKAKKTMTTVAVISAVAIGALTML